MKSHLALWWAPQILAESHIKLSIVQAQGQWPEVSPDSWQAHFMRQFTKHPQSQHRHTTAEVAKKNPNKKSPVDATNSAEPHREFLPYSCKFLGSVPMTPQLAKQHSSEEFSSSSSIMYENSWSSPKTQVSLSTVYLLLLCSYSSVLLKENSCASTN